MSLKETIEKDLEEGKSLDDSLRDNKIRIEDFILEVLRENRELNKRIEVIERYINNWIEESLTPW